MPLKAHGQYCRDRKAGHGIALYYLVSLVEEILDRQSQLCIGTEDPFEPCIGDERCGQIGSVACSGVSEALIGENKGTLEIFARSARAERCRVDWHVGYALVVCEREVARQDKTVKKCVIQTDSPCTDIGRSFCLDSRIQSISIIGGFPST